MGAIRNIKTSWIIHIFALLHAAVALACRLGGIEDELLLTSIQTTILKKDLDWLGYPHQDKMTGLADEPTDIFVSLVDNTSPAIDFISKCAKARFKIGRRSYEGHAFDMIIAGSQTEDLRSDSRLIFKTMLELISRIQ